MVDERMKDDICSGHNMFIVFWLKINYEWMKRAQKCPFNISNALVINMLSVIKNSSNTVQKCSPVFVKTSPLMIWDWMQTKGYCP